MTTRKERANAIRALAMDAVEQAASGHPGAPMGLADIAEVLWRDFLKFNPNDPDWWDRDRFVLSNGHGSMLLYAALHLTGYEVTIDDLKSFRQLHSKTPGHPEYGECPGIETTTGPLGQGFANAVGLAMAEQRIALEFNREGFPIVDHRTWVIVGDGCLMEGISHEAASLAGTLGLGKLIAIYDDNGISIDGETKDWFTEDVASRFEAYGWEVYSDIDGHDSEQVFTAIAAATNNSNRPKLLCCQTIIGYGAPEKAGTASAHGSPLGEDEIAATRKRLNWPHAPFQISNELYRDWDMREAGRSVADEWNALIEGYAKTHPELYKEFSRRMRGDLKRDWNSNLNALAKRSQDELDSLETRKASGACLAALGPSLPELIGGSADLTGSNNTNWDGAGWFLEGGRYLNFGVREFGMSAIANGIALHGGFIPYTGTFLVFMDYARNAVRLSALMGIRQIFVYTHDSVGLGEDGPTHQPIEHLTTLRSTPNMSTWRPCDAVETAVAWQAAVERKEGPTAIVLTRQKTQAQSRPEKSRDLIGSGGYVLRAEEHKLELILLATGSEVELAVEAADALSSDGVGVRVVSMPCVDRFLAQSGAYRDSVLPPSMRSRIAIEAAHPDYWRKFTGLDGEVVGIDRFGVSAPGDVAMNALGINVETILDVAKNVLASE